MYLYSDKTEIITYYNVHINGKIVLYKNHKNNYLVIITSGISMWFERWFLSSNAKDIGVLYLIYALFAGSLLA